MTRAARSLVIDAQRTADFAALLEEITGRPLTNAPWLAPVLLLSDPDVARDLALPKPDQDALLIHDYQSVTFHADGVSGPVEVSQATTRSTGATTEIDVTLSQDAAPVVTMKTALRHVLRADLAARPKAPLLPLAEATVTARAQDLCITQAQVDSYVALSGDRNPIHTDPAEVAALGFDAPIVPGMLLVALAQSLAPDRRLASFKARFLSPLGVGTRFSVALTERGPGQERAVFYVDADRTLAIADLRRLD